MNEPKKIEAKWTYKTTDSPMLIFAFASAIISIIIFLIYIIILRRGRMS
jgi:TRAP-type C4-dicarboxylate transport system permease small subunit